MHQAALFMILPSLRLSMVFNLDVLVLQNILDA